MNRHLDLGSGVVITVTFLLFVIALFAKGLTKDILLEAGVLLVSIKLIMMQYSNRSYIQLLSNKLDRIMEKVEKDDEG